MLRVIILTIILIIYGTVASHSSNVSSIQPPVSGKVVDSLGQPLAGVSVKIKGTARGTTTNAEGLFSLDAMATDVLVFSAVGFEIQEWPLAQSKGPIEMVMKPKTMALQEVVILGYGSQRRETVTGSVSTVTMNKIANIPVVNLSNALAGRVSGVTITNTSGLAGASSSVRVRGSFGDPLYVIDGILRDKAAFDALDQNEVDQMSVLKDAATAAIYGSRAGNGVVIITTRKGRVGKPQFGFQSSYTSSKPTMPLLSDLFTATDELTYQNRVAQFRNEINGKNDPLPNGSAEFAYFKDRNYNVNDWVWRNPQTQKYQLSVNGGSERINFFTLASYTREKGSYVNLDYAKFNVRSNVTATINDYIKLNLNIAAAQQNHDRFYWPFTGDDDYDVGDFYRVTFNWPKMYPFYTTADGTPVNEITPYPVQTPMGSWQAWSVIDQVMGDRYIKTRRRQLTSMLTLDVNLDKITKGLAAKLVGNYEANDYMRKWYLTYQKNYVFIPADPTGNRFIPGPPDPNKTAIFNFSQNQPFLRYNLYTGWNYQLDAYLTYKRQFNRHGIDALMVYEQGENGRVNTTAVRYNPITATDQMFAYSQDPQNTDGNGFEQIGARNSWIGRVNYNFDTRYIAEFSFRYDGNTLFAPNKRWGFFPSGSLAWRISKESFMEATRNWLSDLKLRASYGTTGIDLDINGDPITPFSYLQRYGNTGTYILGDKVYTTIGPGATPNPQITWASVANANLGLDFGFMNNHLNGSLDVFVNKMTDILGARTVTLPATYGQQLAPENYAARSFRGGELNLQWQNMIPGNQEISYSVYGNIAYARDRWDIVDQGAEYLPGGVRYFQSAIGNPVDRLFGLKALGIIRTQQQLDEMIAKGYKIYGRTPYKGAIYYEDIRGDAYSPGADGKIDGNDIQLLSNNGKPRINFGFGFNVGWKGLSLDVHFQGVSAYDKMISNLDGEGIRQWGGDFRAYYPIWTSDVWTPENPNAKYPRVTGQNWAESGTGASSFWVRNGGFLRVKNLGLSYSVPQKFMSHLGISQAQLFMNASNVFTFSKMKEFQDPEQKNYDTYPIMKAVTLGLNLSF